MWHEKTIDVFTTHMVSYFTKVILVNVNRSVKRNIFRAKKTKSLVIFKQWRR